MRACSFVFTCRATTIQLSSATQTFRLRDTPNPLTGSRPIQEYSISNPLSPSHLDFRLHPTKPPPCTRLRLCSSARLSQRRPSLESLPSRSQHALTKAPSNTTSLSLTRPLSLKPRSTCATRTSPFASTSWRTRRPTVRSSHVSYHCSPLVNDPRLLSLLQRVLHHQLTNLAVRGHGDVHLSRHERPADLPRVRDRSQQRHVRNSLFPSTCL